jgi:hypothetical protein
MTNAPRNQNRLPQPQPKQLAADKAKSQQPQQQEEQDGQQVAQTPAMMKFDGRKFAYASAASLIAEPLLALAHTGGIGAIVGLGAGALTYAILDEIEKKSGRELSLPALPTRPERDQSQPPLLYRLLNGKSARGEWNGGGDLLDDEAALDGQDAPQPGQEGRTVDGMWIPPQFCLDDELATVKAFNEQGYIYFGQSEEGAVAVKLSKMYHVIDVSSSGQGKSNRFRLGLMQMVNMCRTYYINPIAAPVKGVEDEREIEVWKVLYDRLANKRPVKKGPEIEDLLTRLVDEIQYRNEQEEQGDFSWKRRPIFCFIDEQPEVAKQCPNAMELIDTIGRMGRNYLVYVWIASQTALVDQIGLSTGTQANLKTRIYGGGDATSSQRLMKATMPEKTERILQSSGAGLTVMLADGLFEVTFTRSPLVTNEALFAYFGLPAFQKEDWMKNASATSTPTSENRRVSTSTTSSLVQFPTSPDRGKAQQLDAREVAQMLDRSGDEVGEVDEVAFDENEVAVSDFSERESLIIDLFFAQKKTPGQIVKILCGGKGGDAYTKASIEVSDTLRKFFEVQQMWKEAR